MDEINWENYAGKSWTEVKEILDKMNFEERYNFIPENGESWKMFEQRLLNTVNKILENKDRNILIVTHGGVIRALYPLLLKLSKAESFKVDVENASVTIFDCNDGNFELETLGDVSHLKYI